MSSLSSQENFDNSRRNTWDITSMMLGGAAAFGGYKGYQRYLKKDNYDSKLDPLSRAPESVADAKRNTSHKTFYSQENEFIAGARNGTMGLSQNYGSPLTSIDTLRSKLNDNSYSGAELQQKIIELGRLTGTDNIDSTTSMPVPEAMKKSIKDLAMVPSTGVRANLLNEVIGNIPSTTKVVSMFGQDAIAPTIMMRNYGGEGFTNAGLLDVSTKLRGMLSSGTPGVSGFLSTTGISEKALATQIDTFVNAAIRHPGQGGLTLSAATMGFSFDEFLLSKGLKDLHKFYLNFWLDAATKDKLVTNGMSVPIKNKKIGMGKDGYLGTSTLNYGRGAAQGAFSNTFLSAEVAQGLENSGLNISFAGLKPEHQTAGALQFINPVHLPNLQNTDLGRRINEYEHRQMFRLNPGAENYLARQGYGVFQGSYVTSGGEALGDALRMSANARAGIPTSSANQFTLNALTALRMPVDEALMSSKGWQGNIGNINRATALMDEGTILMGVGGPDAEGHKRLRELRKRRKALSNTIQGLKADKKASLEAGKMLMEARIAPVKRSIGAHTAMRNIIGPELNEMNTLLSPLRRTLNKYNSVVGKRQKWLNEIGPNASNSMELDTFRSELINELKPLHKEQKALKEMIRVPRFKAWALENQHKDISSRRSRAVARVRNSKNMFHKIIQGGMMPFSQEYMGELLGDGVMEHLREYSSHKHKYDVVRQQLDSINTEIAGMKSTSDYYAFKGLTTWDVPNYQNISLGEGQVDMVAKSPGFADSVFKATEGRFKTRADAMAAFWRGDLNDMSFALKVRRNDPLLAVEGIDGQNVISAGKTMFVTGVGAEDTASGKRFKLRGYRQRDMLEGAAAGGASGNIHQTFGGSVPTSVTDSFGRLKPVASMSYGTMREGQSMAINNMETFLSTPRLLSGGSMGEFANYDLQQRAKALVGMYNDVYGQSIDPSSIISWEGGNMQVALPSAIEAKMKDSSSGEEFGRRLRAYQLSKFKSGQYASMYGIKGKDAVNELKKTLAIHTTQSVKSGVDLIPDIQNGKLIGAYLSSVVPYYTKSQIDVQSMGTAGQFGGKAMSYNWGQLEGMYRHHGALGKDLAQGHMSIMMSGMEGLPWVGALTQSSRISGQVISESGGLAKVMGQSMPGIKIGSYDDLVRLSGGKMDDIQFFSNNPRDMYKRGTIGKGFKGVHNILSSNTNQGFALNLQKITGMDIKLKTHDKNMTGEILLAPFNSLSRYSTDSVNEYVGDINRSQLIFMGQLEKIKGMKGPNAKEQAQATLQTAYDQMAGTLDKRMSGKEGLMNKLYRGTNYGMSGYGLIRTHDDILSTLGDTRFKSSYGNIDLGINTSFTSVRGMGGLKNVKMGGMVPVYSNGIVVGYQKNVATTAYPHTSKAAPSISNLIAFTDEGLSALGLDGKIATDNLSLYVSRALRASNYRDTDYDHLAMLGYDFHKSVSNMSDLSGEDITHLMDAYGISREEVIERVKSGKIDRTLDIGRTRSFNEKLGQAMSNQTPIMNFVEEQLQKADISMEFPRKGVLKEGANKHSFSNISDILKKSELMQARTVQKGITGLVNISALRNREAMRVAMAIASKGVKGGSYETLKTQGIMKANSMLQLSKKEDKALKKLMKGVGGFDPLMEMMIEGWSATTEQLAIAKGYSNLALISTVTDNSTKGTTSKLLQAKTDIIKSSIGYHTGLVSKDSMAESGASAMRFSIENMISEVRRSEGIGTDTKNSIIEELTQALSGDLSEPWKKSVSKAQAPSTLHQLKTFGGSVEDALSGISKMMVNLNFMGNQETGGAGIMDILQDTKHGFSGSMDNLVAALRDGKPMSEVTELYMEAMGMGPFSNPDLRGTIATGQGKASQGTADTLADINTQTKNKGSGAWGQMWDEFSDTVGNVIGGDRSASDAAGDIAGTIRRGMDASSSVKYGALGGAAVAGLSAVWAGTSVLDGIFGSEAPMPAQTPLDSYSATPSYDISGGPAGVRVASEMQRMNSTDSVYNGNNLTSFVTSFAPASQGSMIADDSSTVTRQSMRDYRYSQDNARF